MEKENSGDIKTITKRRSFYEMREQQECPVFLKNLYDEVNVIVEGMIASFSIIHSYP